MYTSKNFKVRNEEEVLAEIKACGTLGIGVKKIFLADGDAMVLPSKKLLRILDTINESFPHLQRVSSYALPKNILRKKAAELKQLKDAGLKLLYVGVESGDDEILKRVDKGETKESTIEGLLAAKEAGIKTSVIILNGLGGESFSSQHAANSADVINKTQPNFLSTLVVSFPLGYERFLSKFGEGFKQLDQKGLFQEVGMLLSQTELEKTVFRSDHASNYLVLKGILGRDKENLLSQIEKAIYNPLHSNLRQEWQRGL